jgi:hypothetical protein
VDWNLVTVFESVADAIPDHTALVQGERRRTWREFDERASRVAAALRGAGLGPGSKVAFYLYNSNEYLETLFACFKLRAVPANVNYRYTADELAYLLDNSDAEAVVYHGELAERVGAVRDRAPKLRAWCGRRRSPTSTALRYEDLIQEHDPMERIDRSGDDLLFLYTGGTTACPGGRVAARGPVRRARSGRVLVLRVGDARPVCRGRPAGRQGPRLRLGPCPPARVSADARHRSVLHPPGAHTGRDDHGPSKDGTSIRTSCGVVRRRRSRRSRSSAARSRNHAAPSTKPARAASPTTFPLWCS